MDVTHVLVGIMPSEVLYMEFQDMAVTGSGFQNLTNFSGFWKIYQPLGGIPRTLRNCTFAIHFENGGRGCVRLAEAL